ncbi:helix-turn-helix transcriptional regulator [Microbispora sp. NBRC 16548]|uniref:helix-turn-helix domain-containing protein n=1 Tax=Microbispora sp. NBRC 16548 TaxID=3030994 RepID=UPI00249FEB6D|nr:helix-turn-helix transcriptional regulator [Microbispora sp. NBRC 16548]GLX06611.1 hypothetical protein Misp03_35380 [Microbispora sp. NBRC 16548]
MSDQALVGKRIKQVRRQRGLSQAQLAHPELSDSYVSLIESGKRAPTAEVLELIAGKLDCSVSYLVTGVSPDLLEDIRVALKHAQLAFNQGEFREARHRYKGLLNDSRLAGLTEFQADAEYGYALAAEACGDSAEAARVLSELLESGAGLDDERLMMVRAAYCRTHLARGDLNRVIQLGEAVLTEAVFWQWTERHVEVGAAVLMAYATRGDLLRAQQFTLELLGAADRIGAVGAAASARSAAAAVAELCQESDKALALARQALLDQEETGDAVATARARMDYARLLLTLQPTEAERVRDLLTTASREAGALPEGVDQLRCALLLACVELALGHPDQALEVLRSAPSATGDAADEHQAQAHLIAGNAYQQLNRLPEAEAKYDAASRHFAQAPQTWALARTWFEIAEALTVINPSAGITAYQRALSCLQL